MGASKHMLAQTPRQSPGWHVLSGGRPHPRNICLFLPQRGWAYKAKRPLSQAKKQKLFLSESKTKPALPLRILPLSRTIIKRHDFHTHLARPRKSIWKSIHPLIYFIKIHVAMPHFIYSGALGEAKVTGWKAGCRRQGGGEAHILRRLQIEKWMK